MLIYHTETPSSIESSSSESLNSDEQQLASVGASKSGRGIVVRKIWKPKKAISFECDICNKKLANSYSLRYHRNKIHGHLFAFRCAICCDAFDDEKSKNLHEKSCTRKRFECYLCKYFNYNEKHFKSHFRQHTGERPHQCNGCFKRFAQEGNLNTHILDVCRVNTNSDKKDAL